MGFKLIPRFSRGEMSPGYLANASPLRFTMYQRAFLPLANELLRLFSMYKMTFLPLAKKRLLLFSMYLMPPGYLANMLLPKYAM